MDDLALTTARVLNGLLGGLYLAFVLAVMPALARQPDPVFSAVMNGINTATRNPLFLVLFLGAPASAVAVAVAQRSWATGLAAVLAVAALVVTFVVHLPLNDALAEGGPRAAFEQRWVTWHALRTALACGALIALVTAAPKA